MKPEAKRRYVEAMVEHARRKTLGATDPVVVDAYKFFNEACDRCKMPGSDVGLPHPFTQGDARRIMKQFDSPLSDALFSESGDSFPIYVMTVGKGILALCDHGKQAVIDSDRTPQAYANACTISGKNGKQCWALFGPNVDRHHPMISSTFAAEKKRLETTAVNYDARTECWDDDTVKLKGRSQQLIEN